MTMADLSRRAFLSGRPQGDGNRVAAVGTACLTLKGVYCQNCRDACEPRAVRFEPSLGVVASPRIDPVACTGCGDCVPICPSAAITLAARLA